jgi:AcrR family transcriptional regulator
MEHEVKSKRRYNSSRRQAQARETRRAIVEAARRLFLERGYTGATIEAIAHEAGVAVDTVYGTFGSKWGVLQRLIEVSVVGDDEPIPLLDRAGPAEVRAEKDPRRQIELFAIGIRQVLERSEPVYTIMRSAAATEPDLVPLLSNLQTQRLAGMVDFVAGVAANVPLRDGVSRADAAETVWTLASPEVFHLLTVDRNWPLDRYESWLGTTLNAVLLPDAKE